MLKSLLSAVAVAAAISTAAHSTVMIGAYLPADGWSSTDVTEFNEISARELAFVNVFSGFSDDWDNLYWQSSNIYSQGAMPLISWMPIDSARYDTNILSEIAAGDWDDYIDTWAGRMKSWVESYGDDRPRVLLRFGHEFNGTWYSYGNDPANYVNAWRHVYQRFEWLDANQHVDWVWSANYIDVDDYGDFTQYYPGDNYVDWTSLDGYNWGSNYSWTSWRDFESIFTESYTTLVTEYPSKPILLAEVGSTEPEDLPSAEDGQEGDDSDADEDKEQWVGSMMTDLQSKFPAIRALTLFNSNKELSWSLTEDNSSGLFAFNSGLADDYFTDEFLSPNNEESTEPDSNAASGNGGENSNSGSANNANTGTSGNANGSDSEPRVSRGRIVAASQAASAASVLPNALTPAQGLQRSAEMSGFRNLASGLTSLKSARVALLGAEPPPGTPFSECKASAFLIQSAKATVYAVNIATGEYSLAKKDMGTRGKVNAVGFNMADYFIYGWSYEHRRPVKIGSDWQIQPLAVDNIADTNFYIGDVSTTTNEYVVYRRGANYGLYSIGLDPSQSSYLQMNRIVSGDVLDLRVADIAFHPDNGYAYAIDYDGVLREINVASGTARELGQVGESGTFGGLFFDQDGYLYASQNRNGKIFRIDVDAVNVRAQLYAQGPSASVNDGARCAGAPVLPAFGAAIDFGDAPASYGTLLADNGARHGLSDGGAIYLGSGVDSESNATVYPMSDDEIDGQDDEDGVQFATALVSGSQTVILVEASAVARLQAWIDLDGNGVFDSDDQIIKDRFVGAGTNALFVDIPANAKSGETWARFRLSSRSGLKPVGGARDGEVEDYRVKLSPGASSVSYYPSPTDWSTIAFEDNWPLEGDYDMNDMIVYLRTATHRTDGLVTHVRIEGEIAAVGASYANGFAIRLPGVLRDQIDEENIEYLINDLPVADYSPLESGRDEAIFILMYNVWNYVSAGENCTFYRTQAGCGSNVQARFSLTVPLSQAVEVPLSGLYDPFLFATPGAWHGSHYQVAPGRSYEIHLKNQPPTEAFDPQLGLVDQGVDASDAQAGLYFQTENGLPWALEIGRRWDYPLEYRDILDAYPQFRNYVNTSGRSSVDWYLRSHAVLTTLFSE